MKKLAALILLTLGLISCNKGDQGVPGPPGPQGNADVFTYYFAVLPQDWVPSGNFQDEDFAYTATFSFPELLTSDLESGLVLGYVELQTNVHAPLPYTYHYDGFSSNLSFIAEPGFITLISKDSDLQTQPYTNTVVFKIVVAGGFLGKEEIEQKVYEQTGWTIAVEDAMLLKE